jgi:hypothetical protein
MSSPEIDLQILCVGLKAQYIIAQWQRLGEIDKPHKFTIDHLQFTANR